MYVLAFDTAQQACSVAISRAGELLCHCYEPMRRGHAEALLPMIERARRRAAIEYEDLDLIAVTVGPGTFTGVRVGLAAARALALVRDIPILGIGTLELLALGAARLAPAMSGGIIAAIDARRGEIYAQAFDPTGAMVTEARAGPVSPNFAPDRQFPGQPRGVIVGSGATLLQRVLPAWRVDHRVQLPDAADLALAAETWPHRASRQPPAPLYLRAPDARLPEQAVDATGAPGP